MPPKENILIYVLRRDLRLDDNPVFQEISRLYMAGEALFTHVLPVYIFSARQVEVSGFFPASEPGSGVAFNSPYPQAKSLIGKLWRCGPHRARFLAESVWDLKKKLEKAESGLCVQAGYPEDIIKGALEYFEANVTGSEIIGVWMTADETTEEVEDEKSIRAVVEAKNKEFRLFKDEKYFIDDDDLPIEDISDLPDIFTTYRKSLEPLNERPRPPYSKPALLPPFPSTELGVSGQQGFNEPTSKSNLIEALLAPLPPSMGLEHPPLWPATSDLAAHSAYPLEGGETAGHARLHHVLASGITTSYKDTRNGLLGTAFSTKLSAYLAMGCLTARQVHEQLAQFEAGHDSEGGGEGDSAAAVEAAAGATAAPPLWRDAPGFGEGESEGGKAVRLELLWRDYMRLCARKFGARLFALGGPRDAATGQRWRLLGDDGSDSGGNSGGNGRGNSGNSDNGGNSGNGSNGNGGGSGGARTRTAAGRDLGVVAAARVPIEEVLRRFLEGRTGLGLIDASQRELFLTGYTSNRARQNVASFLAKHLQVDWRLGAEWYECMLVDYDAASNWGNWQYASGVGNDPREERIFNPVKQALDYDPKGEYVTTWVPELRGATEKEGPEAMMVLYQAWRIDDETKERLGLKGLEWVDDPLVRIQFSVGRKPRPKNGKGRYYRSRGRKGRREDNDKNVGAEPVAS